jgi:hypothetical protein
MCFHVKLWFLVFPSMGCAPRSFFISFTSICNNTWYTVWHRISLQVVLDFQTFNFCITCSFVHYNSHPLLHLLCTRFRLHQADKKHFQLSHSGALKLSRKLYFVSAKWQKGFSQWPARVRLGSAVACLLRLWVSILPWAWMLVLWVLSVVK